MANFLVKISYNGTMFYGFQRQPKYKNTVQEEVETLLSKLLNENITIFGAGRTDKGVHALNQCFNFQYVAIICCKIKKVKMLIFKKRLKICLI